MLILQTFVYYINKIKRGPFSEEAMVQAIFKQRAPGPMSPPRRYPPDRWRKSKAFTDCFPSITKQGI